MVIRTNSPFEGSGRAHRSPRPGLDRREDRLQRDETRASSGRNARGRFETKVVTSVAFGPPATRIRRSLEPLGSLTTSPAGPSSVARDNVSGLPSSQRVDELVDVLESVHQGAAHQFLAEGLDTVHRRDFHFRPRPAAAV